MFSLLLPLTIRSPNRNHANPILSVNLHNRYKVLATILVSDSSMTLDTSFKSLAYLTVCIRTHFLDLLLIFHISCFYLPLVTAFSQFVFSHVPVFYHNTKHRASPLLPSLPHSHSGVPFAVLIGLLTTSLQNLPWISSIIFHRNISPTFLHSHIISYALSILLNSHRALTLNTCQLLLGLSACRFDTLCLLHSPKLFSFTHKQIILLLPPSLTTHIPITCFSLFLVF
jgi:hypothetical protein